MEKRVIAVFSIILTASLLSLSVVSAVWWNPFTWFQKNVYYSPEENLTETNSSVPSNQTPINITPICTPKTCVQLGKTCGAWNDECGIVLNCGTCTNGSSCSNGSCVITPVLTNTTTQTNISKFCKDSDGGNNPSKIGSINSSNCGIVTDYCYNGKVQEYFCSSSNLGCYTSNLTTCPNGCSNGSCVITPVLTNTTNQSTTSAKKEILTCQKQYQTAWNTSKCNSTDCGNDKYTSCSTKYTRSGWWIQRQYREICRVTSTTACIVNPTCPTGYNKISKSSC